MSEIIDYLKLMIELLKKWGDCSVSPFFTYNV